MGDMPLLATVADLTVSRVEFDSEETALVHLGRASAAIRDAAGSLITKTTSTVTFGTEASRRIELPARCVHDVAEVLLDGVPVTGWVLIGSHLWRDTPWHDVGGVPRLLQVTFTHGWDPVPADIVSLTCSLAAAGLAAAEKGYDPGRGFTYERIDDYQYGKASGDNELVDPYELPARTKEALRKRFAPVGGHVTGMIR